MMRSIFIFLPLLFFLCSSGWAKPDEEVEDEVICLNQYFFKCSSGGQCFANSSVCNGEKDCLDNTDELLCECTNDKQCEAGYKCKKNLSSAISKCELCAEGYEFNGDQCDDVDECRKHPTICAHEGSCVNFPGGYTCVSCPKGFDAKMQDDRYFKTMKHESDFNRELVLCDDRDECEQENMCFRKGGQCVNEVGRFKCHCPANHRPDRGVCTAIGEVPKIALADTSSIYIYDLRSEVAEKHFAVESATIVDIASYKDSVFYALENQIWEYRLETERKSLVANLENEETRLKKITVDWVNKRVYFVTTDSLSVVEFFGTGVRLIDHRGTITSVVVDPIARRLFYCAQGSVFRANLDGSNATLIFSGLPIIEENFQSGEALTLDPILKALYYIYDRVLYTFDYSGKRDKLVLSTAAPYANIEVFEDILYATYRSDGTGLVTLHRPGYTVGRNNRTATVRFIKTRPKFMAVIHTSKFPERDGSQPCYKKEVCRSHWCFPLPLSESKSYKCVCYPGESDNCLRMRVSNYRPEDVNARRISSGQSIVPTLKLTVLLSLASMFILFL